MTVFIKLINFVNIGMIDLFEFIDLIFQQLSLIGSYFIFVNDIDRSNKFGFFMYSFS